MTEIRSCIDAIDHELVKLIGQRVRYVEAASAFKNDAAGVRAEERQRKMLVERREWAAREGVDPELIDELFRNMVRRFIELEMQRFEERR
ncbi:MAG: chorismate mutase [Acidobacteriota bacterium]